MDSRRDPVEKLKETKENQIGFVAQELEEVFPSLVYETDDTQDKEDGSIEKKYLVK